MKVTILFIDNTVETYEGIRKVTNASHNIPNDWIYVYRFNDIPGQPSIRYPMKKVNCVEVLLDGFTQ